ncbi:hypothetical protein ACFX12_027734 [Malus domestica]
MVGGEKAAQSTKVKGFTEQIIRLVKPIIPTEHLKEMSPTDGKLEAHNPWGDEGRDHPKPMEELETITLTERCLTRTV